MGAIKPAVPPLVLASSRVNWSDPQAELVEEVFDCSLAYFCIKAKWLRWYLPMGINTRVLPMGQVRTAPAMTLPDFAGATPL